MTGKRQKAYQNHNKCELVKLYFFLKSVHFWWATVHGVTKGWTRLSDFTFTFTALIIFFYF